MTEFLESGDQLGKCQLVLRIGRGGMATIWVARQYVEKFKEERLVAVKAMLPELVNDDEFVRMFLDEGKLVSAIQHPNVVEVYEVDEQNGIMYMSMEWIEGESLHSIIAEAGKRRAIPSEIAVRVIADVAAGLHAAHELRDAEGRLKGVVHRDVSPHNILIGTSGVTKLVDFGVAKAVGRMSDETQVGQIKGKFGYMSPEQALGKKVDRRSDIFSLGIVLFELTTNRRLFRGATDVETLRLVVSGTVPKPSQIDPNYPPALERIVVKALERRIQDRYPTAEALRVDLENYLKNERIVVPRSGVAGLLKRVLGARLEERRAAVRAALSELRRGSAPDLVPPDDAAAGVATVRTQGSGTASVRTRPGGPHALNARASDPGVKGATPEAVVSRIAAVSLRKPKKLPIWREHKLIFWVTCAGLVLVGAALALRIWR